MKKYFLGSLFFTSFLAPVYLSVPLGGFFIYPFRFLLFCGWGMGLLGIPLNGKIRRGKIKALYCTILFFLLWFLYAVSSFLWVQDTDYWMRSIMHLFTGFSIIIFCLFFIENVNDLKYFFFLWLIALVLANGIGLWETTTGKHLLSSTFTVQKMTGQYIPTAFFYNTNDFATFLSFSMCFALAFFKRCKGFVSRFFMFFLISITFYNLLVTGSRANILASLISVTLFLCISLKLHKIKDKAFALLIALGIFLVFLALSYKTSAMQSLIGEIRANEDSGAIRVNLIKNAFIFFLNTYSFGVGSGNVEWFMKNTPIWNTQNILNVHNWWIEILVNYGIMIFIPYLIFFIDIIKKSYRMIRFSTDSTDLLFSEVIFMGSSAFFLASMSSSSLLNFLPQWFFWGFSLSVFALKTKKYQNN